jgi:hypothetical protein
MNISVLFEDVLAEQFGIEEYENLPAKLNVMDYSWFLVTSDVYSHHVQHGGVGVRGFNVCIIGRLNDPNETPELLTIEPSNQGATKGLHRLSFTDGLGVP